MQNLSNKKKYIFFKSKDETKRDKMKENVLTETIFFNSVFGIEILVFDFSIRY